MRRKMRMLALLPVLMVRMIAQSAYDPNSPDGKLIEQITHESDDAKKQALLQELVTTYPDSKQAAWAWGQLQGDYLKAQQYDKAIEAGEKSLASRPDQVEVAYNNLKAAEGKDDAELVVKWASATSQAARKEVAASGADQARLDYAKQVDTYTEYSDYAQSLKTNDPAKIVRLVQSLEQRNPQSPYLTKAYGRYLNALKQQGESDKAAAGAEQELQRDPNNEDVLLFAATYDAQKGENDKALKYASAVTKLMQSKPKPDDIGDADWSKKQQTYLGLSYWIQGMAYNGQQKFTDADKALKAALPLVKDNKQVLPIVLFQLGVADFAIGKASKSRATMQEALKYTQQSAAMASPVQGEAANNAKAMARSLAGAR
jgi:tetratricopeptide (TPR) repeat protein